MFCEADRRHPACDEIPCFALCSFAPCDTPTNQYLYMAPRSRKATAARRAVLAAALLATTASAQTFRRTAACPTLGCIFPPSESSFIAGQVFDIRLEAQAPANGSMPFNNGVVVGEPELWIGCKNKELQKLTDFFKIDDVKSDAYNFTYYEVRCLFLPFLSTSFPPRCRTLSSPAPSRLVLHPHYYLYPDVISTAPSARTENAKIQLSDGYPSLPRTSLPRMRRPRPL